jgi:hypothetical protein
MRPSMISRRAACRAAYLAAASSSAFASGPHCSQFDIAANIEHHHLRSTATIDSLLENHLIHGIHVHSCKDHHYNIGLYS